MIRLILRLKDALRLLIKKSVNHANHGSDNFGLKNLSLPYELNPYKIGNYS
jgi:hypothetical protein